MSAAADPAAGARAVSRQALSQGLERLGGALVEIRRVSHGLRPALLDDLGLAAALALLIEQENACGACAIRFRCEDAPVALGMEHGTALFRIAQEALQNVSTHVRATQVELVLRGAPGSVSLSVIDNGCGFDTHRVFADGRRGIGLRNMRERAAGLGGSLVIASSRAGTRIQANLPLPVDEALPNRSVMHPMFRPTNATP